MNYGAIYTRFIESRRKLPVQEYMEDHHILPVSRGGSDADENRIYLSPEDHFFAHLLLAKIYGGRLWVPVVMWLGGDRRNWCGKRSRLQYAWARRAASKASSGRGAHQYDFTLYRLEHTDGRKFVGTQSDVASVLGLTRSGVNLLIKGKTGSLRGWFLEGRKPQFVGRGSRKGNLHPMAVPSMLSLRHVDGRSFLGTQHELHITHGISKPSACRLAKGQQTIAGGWYIEGSEPSPLGRAASYLKASSEAECI